MKEFEELKNFKLWILELKGLLLTLFDVCG